MLIGYARVSTDDQDTALQIDALKRAGCEKIYEERASGSRTDRPELNKALAHGRKGDMVIVWKLDRLGRSLPHLIDTVHDLEERKVGFRSLTDNIDTTTASGRMFFHMMGALRAIRARSHPRENDRRTQSCPRARQRGRPAEETQRRRSQIRALSHARQERALVVAGSCHAPRRLPHDAVAGDEARADRHRSSPHAHSDTIPNSPVAVLAGNVAKSLFTLMVGRSRFCGHRQAAMRRPGSAIVPRASGAGRNRHCHRCLTLKATHAASTLKRSE